MIPFEASQQVHSMSPIHRHIPSHIQGSSFRRPSGWLPFQASELSEPTLRLTRPFGRRSGSPRCVRLGPHAAAPRCLSGRAWEGADVAKAPFQRLSWSVKLQGPETPMTMILDRAVELHGRLHIELRFKGRTSHQPVFACFS